MQRWKTKIAALFMAAIAITGTATAAASASGGPSASLAGYVHVAPNGHGLQLNGAAYEINGATGYGEYDNPSAQVALAQKMHLNNLETVEFFCNYHTLPDAESACTMNRLDGYIAAAEAAGLHVVINLSEYYQSQQAAGHNPCTVSDASYISFMANHVNSVNGRTYGTDPGISLVEVWGELPAPNYGGAPCTTAQVTSFYHRTLAELRAGFPNTMLSSGGVQNINDPGSGIPWKAIFSDPNNNVCSMEINSTNDRDISYPMVTSYCNSLTPPKPTWVAAWSVCHGPPRFNGDLNYYQTQSAGAAHATQMLGYSDKADTAGSDFWNLKTNPGWPAQSCDIGDGDTTVESAVINGEA